jgi:Glu-tRNA(Gln) amidotransferase subunit E-like FAD-binding protein
MTLEPPVLSEHALQGDMTEMGFDEIHDAHVQQVLELLSARKISGDAAETVLRAMTQIAEDEGYGG